MFAIGGLLFGALRPLLSKTTMILLAVALLAAGVAFALWYVSHTISVLTEQRDVAVTQTRTLAEQKAVLTIALAQAKADAQTAQHETAAMDALNTRIDATRKLLEGRNTPARVAAARAILGSGHADQLLRSINADEVCRSTHQGQVGHCVSGQWIVP